ncbi:MAG TPA: hypothetical protein VM533_19315 [Fimbriiglobus sp.]|nr:hypothetical protein [Fimbriiglobus sp.]
MTRLVLTAALLLTAGVATAADPVPPTDTQVLSQTLRDLLLLHLPEPLVSSDHGWGRQKEVAVGLKWRREGKLRVRAEPQKALRNDGHWQRVTIRGIDPARTLALGVGEVTHPEPGKATFDAMLGLDVRLTYEQQLWKSGARLYAGETRARCRAALKLKCELTSRLEPRPGSLLPDAVFRVRVTDAELYYADLVCEHTLGLDGKPAEEIGEAVHKLIKKVKPSLESDLLAKANAAVVKAADTKEVRVEFGKLLAGQPPAVKREGKK